MRKVGHGLKSGKWSQKMIDGKQMENRNEEYQGTVEEECYQDGCKPAMFKTLVGKGHPEFQTGKQQDTREYY